MKYSMHELLEVACAAAPLADFVTLRVQNAKSNSFAMTDGVLDGVSEGSDYGAMVEVFYQGAYSYAATPTLTEDGIECAARKAFDAVRAKKFFNLCEFDTDVRPQTFAEYKTPVKKHTAPSLPEIIDSLSALCSAMRVNDKIISTNAYLFYGVETVEIASSLGAHSVQEFNYIGYNFQATARKDEIIQHRSYNGSSAMTFQGGWELFDLPKLLIEAKRIGEEACELLTAEESPTDKRTLVLMPNQMMLQIHESVGHALEVDRILGDELNFAGGSFVKLSDIGTMKYGSSLMNIVFDPTNPIQLANYAVDTTGTPAEKKYLIKDGLLIRGLGGIESEQRIRSYGAHVANMRSCSWNRPPIDRMANINLEPGKTSFDKMIASIEKGILMDANRSWSIDDYRNKFQFGCEYGKLIENGKLTKTVRNPNYRGITSNFWHNLIAVGDASTFQAFGTPNCGKGEPNQVIFVSHASPVCAFKETEVFGGGK
ncbi:MAG: TldD/PmbA family protein [Treponemataceae bacterium]